MSVCWLARTFESLQPVGVALVALTFAGCGAVIPRVTPELVTAAQQRDPSLDALALERVRSLYVDRCSSCHSLNDPRAYSAEEWPDWMRKMARKSKLTVADEQHLLTFVLTAREMPLPP
jgi:mono/diheme cytochrome c family protein